MKAFDMLIRQALAEKVRDVEPSDDLLKKIRTEADERRKETGVMKFGMKKVVAVAAVCLLSVTCYAATQLGGAVSHSNNQIVDFADMEKAEKKIGMDAKYVEHFANGFTFDRGGTGETQGLDEEGNPMGKTYLSLNVSYRNEAGDWVVLLVEDGNVYADAGQPAAEGYSLDTYMFVPPDYELTEEDKAKEAAGELVISYGSEEVEIQQMEGYSWQDGGLYYSLTASDCGFGEEEMAKMAAEIMAE